MTAVSPYGNCPHLKDNYTDIENMPKHWKVPLPCKTCSDTSENWICLTCFEINCSRFVNGHAKEHFEKTGHGVVASFSDFSVWCYNCTSPDDQPGWYIKHPTLRPILQFLYQLKFPDDAEAPKNSHSGRSPNEDITEYYDEPDVVAKKVSELAAMIKSSKHIVAYTGAGVSTSAKIPDYRGPKGIWTLRDKGMSTFMEITLEQALPTSTHMSLVELKKSGILKFLVSTNVDGLHRRSGFSASEMSELHGNCYKEYCTKCKKEYLRTFDCASHSSDHLTERKCEACKISLHDTIINFGESLPEDEVQKTILEAHKSDLSLVLGTSMRVRPACEFPLEALKNKGKMVIVNLQKTPYDGYAALIIREKTDKVMELLMKELGLTIPEYKIENDFTKSSSNAN